MSRNFNHFNHFKLKNLLSALPAIDTVSIDHPPDPKSLRFTWNEYNPKLVEKLVSEKLFIVDPGILNLHFSDLSFERKRGVPAAECSRLPGGPHLQMPVRCHNRPKKRCDPHGD